MTKRTLPLCILLASATAPITEAGAETSAGTPTITAVHIVSRVADSETTPDDRPKRALAEVGVTLHAVIEVGRGRERVFYSDANPVRVRGEERKTSPMSEAPRSELSWFKVESAVDWLSNTESGSFRYERIEYRAVPVRGWRGKTTVARADVTPTLTPDRGQGVGTMRYQLVARARGQEVASPGIDARRSRGSGGLEDSVHRVSLRRDDTYLGMMTEMFGQPYIWASGGSKARSHQSERLEGSDCADLMVYGARRKGFDIPYTWTGGLHEYTRELASGAPREDGVYVDADGAPIPFTRAGDMLLFPRHVGALVEDRGVPGVLDNRDVMMHTYFATPREQPVVETPYGDAPIKLIRWKRRLD